MKRRLQAFTLIEVLVVVSIIAIAGAVAMPSYARIMTTSQGTRCCANILQIESAKDQFIADHPGQAIASPNDLMPYLKYGMPACPSGGAYSNVTNRYGRVSCSLDDGVIDGLHDYGRP
jgi:prepilin-type N-terminal cleavage/methylation domain-containing protein